MKKCRAGSFIVSKLANAWLVSARGVAVETFERPEEAISYTLERFFADSEELSKEGLCRESQVGER
jgi:hypothetical protein